MRGLSIRSTHMGLWGGGVCMCVCVCVYLAEWKQIC